MSTLWRISKHLDLEGSGGRFFSSRWSAGGSRIVYLAESPAGAMLETLVHLPFVKGRMPEEYNLMKVEFPDECLRRNLVPPKGVAWTKNIRLTQRIGDAWLASRETALARVPSAILPFTLNLILNPEHSNAAQVRIASVIREKFDNRLFRFGTQ